MRHTPIVGFGASEKKDKVAYHRKLRRKVNEVLHADPEAEIQPVANEVANVRRWHKDPRHWSSNLFQHAPELQRK
jgi:hypothetical protein